MVNSAIDFTSIGNFLMNLKSAEKFAGNFSLEFKYAEKFTGNIFADFKFVGSFPMYFKPTKNTIEKI